MATPTAESVPAPRSLRTAIAAALLGLFTSGYLLIEYLGAADAICLTGGGCDAVRDSVFAYPLGIPMPLFGVGFYLVALVLLLLPEPVARVSRGRRSQLLVLVAGAGVVTSVALTVIEVTVIGALCSWCLVSAGAAAALFVAVIAGRRRAPGGLETTGRSRAVRERQRRAAIEARQAVNRFAIRTGAALAAGFAALLVIGFVAPADGPAEAGPPAVAGRAQLGSGSVLVTVFSDFECPACSVAATVLHALVDEGQVTVEYRHFPLTSIHDKAMPAALAAEAARVQGHFWEMHDRLFATQEAWSIMSVPEATAYFEQLATGIGLDLDLDRYRQDRDSTAVGGVVDRDLEEAIRLALRGTPTIFVGGTRYEGPISLEGLRSAVGSTGTP